MVKIAESLGATRIQFFRAPNFFEMLQRWLSPSEMGPSPQRLQGEEEAVVAQDVMLCTPVRSLKGTVGERGSLLAKRPS